MKYWQFMNYHTEEGRNLIQEWYEAEDEAVQAAFDMTLNTLAGLRDWTDTWQFKILTGNHAGLCELKFLVGKTKYRPVGFFDPGASVSTQFVLILGCKKSGRIYTPVGAFDTALELKRLYIDEGKGSIHEHLF